MAVLKKLKLLLWKNFILKRRKTLITLLEMLMPLLFCAIVLYLRLNSMPRKKSSTNYPAVDVSLLPVYFYNYPLKSKFQLAYIPSKSETLKAVTEVVEQTFAVDFEVLGFPSVPSFEDYIIKDPKSFYILVGIIFHHYFNSSNDPLPLVVKYDLRFSYVQRNFVSPPRHLFFQEEIEGWCTAFLYPPNLSQAPREFSYADGGNPGYNKEGFLAIQHAVDKAIMRHHTPQAALNMFRNLHVLVQRFPLGPHIQDPFLVILQNEFPLLLMLSFVCVELIITNSVLLEKERKQKEYMCMMGVESWLHWVAWFITFFVSVLITVSVMTVLFCTKINRVAVFRNSNPTLIFIFLMFFAIATIFFAFMMSTFFQRAHVGTVMGGTVFFFTYLPYMYITFSYHQRTYTQKILSCLFSNVAMAMGVRFISLFEAEGTGIQWRNIGSVWGDFSFTQVMGMLLLDSLLYCLVAVLVESLFPGKFGIPKSWYIFAKKPVPAIPPLLNIGDPEKPSKGDFMQDEPMNQMNTIEIQHLYKVFYTGRNKRTAIKDLSMNLYKGQITVLLGHNGAGKTTICSVLTGLITPSKGHVYIHGYEISKDMVQIRKSLGWCPQHDILFDNFTVTDHLYFYAQLKGLSPQNCHKKIEEMLHILGLEDKRDSRSKFLSGGMKRKLSIGIALIAGSKVLILDEPTSGMDAVSRRAIWDLLQQQKSGRTVLLTTHFMDEADLLGDRIAILAKGELQCCGSSLFLKQKYGAGYYMTIIKTPLCDTSKLSKVIYHHIPNAILESSIGEEMIFTLPKKTTPRFEALFTDLELRQTELGISTFATSVTTMEEVFIRVCKLADPSTNVLTEKRHPLPRHHRIPVDRIKCLHSRIFSVSTEQPMRLNTGFCLLCQQFYAMLLKKVTYSRRNWMLVLSVQLLLPLAIVMLSLTFFNFKLRKLDNVPLELTLQMYGQTIVPFFIAENSHLDPQLSDNFVKMLVAAGQVPLRIRGSVENFLLKKAKEAPEDFDKLYVVAASFEDVNNHTTVKALFNNQAYHSPGLALALVDNLLFKLLSGTNASITTTNYPQPQTAIEVSESILYQGPKGHYLVVNFLFGIAFLSSSFSILTVGEKSVKSKSLQFASGVNMAVFWLSALLWDLISFLIPTLLVVLVFLWYEEEAFAHHENIPAVVLIMMLYGWAIIPLVYTVSFSFNTPGSACVKLVVMLAFLSISPVVLVTVTSEKDLGYTELSDSLDHVFLILPGHCLGMALSNLYYNFELKKFCNAKNLSDIDCNDVLEGYVVQENIYAWESLGIGRYLTALAVLGPVYITLLFLTEASAFYVLKSRLSGFFPSFWKEKSGMIFDVKEPEDEDVLEETETIKRYLETLIKKTPLVVKEVSKVYNEKAPLLAVNKVSFVVKEEECFCLLGLNGAGKTSVFNMLTSEQPVTSGDAFIKGFSIKSDIVKVRQWIGYCPEFDALLNFMTGREMLVMYARIRGIPECHIKACVDLILENLLMCVCADKLVKTYSGGNKRMLSTGIALVGEPAVILLDEPSTGMDPVARRLLWDTVARARESGKAIVITSHSMEECEALCTRLAIMVRGQFKCLGSPQHLKSKFGSGYSLQAKVRSEGKQEVLEEFKAFVDLTFPGSNLEDEHQNMVQYCLPDPDLSWAKVFSIMEQAKKDYMLEDYSISQLSLEDIFLNFTRPESSTKEKIQQGQAVPASPLPPSRPISSPPSQLSSQPPKPLPSPPPSEPVLL